MAGTRHFKQRNILVRLKTDESSAPAALFDEHETETARFFEVHVATPAQVCAERDVKGLYARQRSGALSGLTGIDGEYEPLVVPDPAGGRAWKSFSAPRHT